MILHLVTGFLCWGLTLTSASTIVREGAVCKADDLSCGDGSCVGQERACDGVRDCLDGTDEEGCPFKPLHDISLEPEFLIHRSKRQAAKCGKMKWQCRDGTCINFDGKCDGLVDCPDGSDETHPLCRGMKCQSFWFRCAYGACVDGTAPCNDVKECADDSDEIGPRCHTEPDDVGNQFKCADGSRIASSDKCDGIPHCADGSDETVRACANVTCASHLFQCAYGACVDQNSDCNGKQDCADGSDENEELCGSRNGGHSVTKQCKLPPFPKHGRYEVKDNQRARPGQILPFATVTVVCDKGYAVQTLQTEYHCLGGGWTNGQTVPLECVRQCQLNLNSDSISYTECIFQGSQKATQCLPRVPSGTVVTKPVCRAPDYYTDTQLSEMTCLDGQWDYSPHCRPECGRITADGKLLVFNGTSAKHGEFPWHVGVYVKGRHYRQICGGSIIKNNLVLSAAHCFWDTGAKRINPASNYAVAAGKIYKPWGDDHDTETQTSDVEKLYTHQSFFGQDNNYANDITLMFLVTAFVYRPYIRPVCIRFDRQFEDTQLTRGSEGKIAGWGLTSAKGGVTGTLQTTSLPYINEAECNEKAPIEFKPFIVQDKMCAGYNDGTSALCQGDSGGGLVFPSTDFGIQRYYLRGIVSTSPQSADKCNIFAIVTFTKVSAHESMIRPYIKDNL